MHSHFKREDPEHRHNSIKANPKSNSVNLRLLILGLMIFWAPMGLGSSCPALPSTAHLACLIGSGQIHSSFATVIGHHLMVLASQKFWNFCSNCRNSFFLALFRDSDPALLCHISTSLHDSFSSRILLQLRLHLHPAFPSLSQCQASGTLNNSCMPLKSTIFWKL